MKNLEQMELFDQTSSQEDTHANLSQSQVNKLGRETKDTSGQKCLDLSKSAGRRGLLERMLVDTLNSVSTPHSITWKARVTPQGRLVFQRAASVRGTKEKGSGLLPTPTAMTGGEGITPSNIKGTHGWSLGAAVRDTLSENPIRMWLTPNAMDSLPIRSPEALEKQYLKNRTGRTTHSTLREQVVYPPPNKMFPTPTANEDAAGTPAGKMQRMLGNCKEVRGETPEQWKSGNLNPDWVEWLMGYPIGHTDLKD